jgi:hypothetical protein
MRSHFLRVHKFLREDKDMGTATASLQRGWTKPDRSGAAAAALGHAALSRGHLGASTCFLSQRRRAARSTLYSFDPYTVLLR